MNPIHDSEAEDLRPVIDLLHARRPEATALELDSVKQRVMRRAAGSPAGRRARSANLMKSRLAILSMLVAGMLMSTTGAGLAVTSFTGNDASVAQYGHDNGGDKPDRGVLGGDNGTSNGTGNGSPSGGTSGGAPSNTTTTTLQPTRQVETGAAGSGDLPFTGYLAIPVLLGGAALLGAGVVMRRRSAADRS
jgi:hypothetical protein